MTQFAVLIIGLLPPSEVKNRLLRRCGWRIGSGVSININLFWSIRAATLGDGCVIGPFNTFRNLNHLDIGTDSRIGQLNYVTGAPDYQHDPAHNVLQLAEHAIIVSRHYLDTSGGLRMGRYSGIGGVRTTIYTHGVDYRTNTHQPRPVVIGEYALLNSNVCIAPGTTVPPRSVVSMGSVLTGRYRPGTLISSGRAKSLMPVEGAFFTRDDKEIRYLRPDSPDSTSGPDGTSG